MDLHTCPVLELQASGDAISAFDACYRVASDGFSGRVAFERVVLPHAGGVLDQPARLMESLQLIEAVASEELAADVAAYRRQKQDRDNG